jgi:putative transcriptional regulator
MNITHHLDDATLMSYSAGALSDALAAVVASHLDMCPTCCRRLRSFEVIGGAMLTAVEPVPISDGLRDRLLNGFSDDNVRSFPLRRTRAAVAETSPSEIPRPLRRFIDKPLDDIRWSWLAPGIRQHTINMGPESRGELRLFKIKPGTRMPEHGHGGSELTLILRGAYHDRYGRFGVGDVADLDEDAEHEPRVDKSGECICLVATEKPAQFKSIISRIMQPLLGM